MFTGIVEELGELQGREGGRGGSRLTIAARQVLEDLKLGDSIAVNGACLTVTRLRRGGFEALVAPETLDKTNLGELVPGCRVNLERALPLGGRLGGHLVSGHIDGVGRLLTRQAEGEAIRFSFQVPPGLQRYIISKGSIAVDGISLTVASLEDPGFTVSVVPHTADNTTLGEAPLGAAVNLEVDLIGKYVERLLSPAAGKGPAGSKITVSLLQEKGFI